MRVGVDISILCGPPCGIRRYTANLLNSLIRQSGKDYEWFLYSPSKEINDFECCPRTVLRHANFSSSWGKKIWAFFLLPNQLTNDELDFVWFPTHRFPMLKIPSRCAVTIHDLTWRRFPESMSKATFWLDCFSMKRALANADRIFTVSEYIKSEIAYFYPRISPNVYVVYEGCNLYAASSPVEEVGNQAFFLCVGTREPRKNYARVIEAYGALDEEVRRNQKLVIAGRKGWGKDIESLLSRKQFRNDVYLLGEVTDSQLVWLYKNALCLVFPSVYEGFGLPVLEALSFGLPVITSVDSPMIEIARNCALYVNPLSVEEISSAMTKMAFGDEERRKMSECGLNRADLFTWDSAATQILAKLKD